MATTTTDKEMTITEAAYILGLSAARIGQMLRDGTLRGVKYTAKGIRVFESSVHAEKQRRETPHALPVQ